MSARTKPLSADRLREMLNYDALTGEFRWRNDHRNKRALAGSLAGCVYAGRRQIGIDGGMYRTNRLVWLYVYSAWPNGTIDHKNGDSLDDSLENLRDCPQSNNCKNRKTPKSNTSGYKGVSFNKARRKWVAQISIEYRTVVLGLFESPEEASAAYWVAAQIAYGEFARAA